VSIRDAGRRPRGHRGGGEGGLSHVPISVVGRNWVRGRGGGRQSVGEWRKEEHWRRVERSRRGGKKIEGRKYGDERRVAGRGWVMGSPQRAREVWGEGAGGRGFRRKGKGAVEL